MTDLIVTRIFDQHAEIVLNRPDKRNAINDAMMQGISAALDSVEKLPNMRAILFRGEGPHFSAGIDITGLLDASARFGEGWRQNLFPLTAAYQEVANKLERCTVPTICLMHGFCLGMGFELALACDLRIAAVGARMGLPESRLGLIPDVGGTARLTRLVGIARAKEYVMTGKEFALEDAERWGVVNHVVAAEDLQLKAEQLIAELSAAAPLAVRFAKLTINDMTDIQQWLKIEAWAQMHLIQSEDFINGAQAMMLKQQPDWQGK